jgi:hypothetical protein
MASKFKTFVQQQIAPYTHQTSVKRDEIKNLADKAGVRKPKSHNIFPDDQVTYDTGKSIEDDQFRSKLNRYTMKLEDPFYFRVDPSNFKIWLIIRGQEYMIIVLTRLANRETCKTETDRWSISAAIEWMNKENWHHPNIKERWLLWCNQLDRIEWRDALENFKSILKDNASRAEEKKSKIS